jgi:TonB family protein
MQTAELQMMAIHVELWRQITDDVFEQHYRKRYFGDESLSRQEAISRLVAAYAGRLHTAPVGAPATNGSESSEALPAPPPSAQADAVPVSAAIKLAMLPDGRPPWPSMLLSLLTHGLILSLLLSVRLQQRKHRLIDFDTETITYYTMAESFPDVAPRARDHGPRNVTDPTPQPADFQTREEVRIRPMESALSETVIEQPNVRQMPVLPKLQLPNILLQTAKTDPGRAPLAVPADILRHLAADAQPLQSLGSLPPASAQTLATRQPAMPLPQIAALAEPVSEALQVSQVGGSLTALQRRAALLPYAAPPLEESQARFEVETMPARGSDLLVFSVSPVIPKGSIAVPKASSQARLTGSSMPAAQLPQGVRELSITDVVIPSISISSRTAPLVAGAGAAVVQAPLPAPPALPQPPSLARSSSLLDFLPSSIASSKTLARAEIASAESPLQDYESRGGPVYTAAINAPNFTSKRGSWIFRFAELPATGPASSPANPAGSLTAPSAVVKVDPKYAPEVVREKLEGVVILFAILRKDGTIDGESVRIVRKLDGRLDQSAREALLNWRFRPSQRDGIAVDIQMEVSIPFYFRKDAP